MLNDCIEVFAHELKKKTEKWLLDNYVPKDGTYILINIDRNFQFEESVDIVYDKKNGGISGRTHKDFRLIQFLDYNSKLLEMNKPIDPKKVIHSNNLYSFFLKKESLADKKVTREIVGGYYNIISNPELKYTKSKANALYKKVEEDIGGVDTDTVNRIKEWIDKWIENPILPSEVDLSKKNYLKLFFIYDDREKTQRLYERENKRYLIPNIYNSNDYNEEIDGVIFGLPSNNMGMNAKKPYLGNKSRKTEVPHLLDMDEVLLQSKFFDYLWGQASVGKVNVYIDFDKKCIKTYDNKEAVDEVSSGGYLRIRKDKNEAQIQYMDSIVGYEPELRSNFVYKNILNLKPEALEEISAGYGSKTKLYEMNLLFDEVFFGKKLIFNYFNEPSEITFQDNQLENILLTYRDCLFAWFYKGIDTDMQRLSNEIGMKMIYHSLCNGYFNKVKHQMNLMWSLSDYFEQNNRMEETVKVMRENLKKHLDMYEQEWTFENDEEYYYAVGQTINYFLSLSKAAKRPLSIVNSFLNAASDKIIKEKIVQMFQKYNYDIDSQKDVRFRNLFTHILKHEAVGKVQKDKLTAGLLDNSIIYEPKAKNKEGGILNE